MTHTNIHTHGHSICHLKEKAVGLRKPQHTQVHTSHSSTDPDQSGEQSVGQVGGEPASSPAGCWLWKKTTNNIKNVSILIKNRRGSRQCRQPCSHASPPTWPEEETYWSKLANNHHWGGWRRGVREEGSHADVFFPSPLFLFLPALCLRRCRLLFGCCPGLELGAGWWLGGGHDLHVLGKDGLERLVPVDHSAEHQRLRETER